MYNAHGQEEKVKSYPVRKSFDFETSEAYNKRVRNNAIVFLTLFIVVICALSILSFVR